MKLAGPETVVPPVEPEAESTPEWVTRLEVRARWRVALAALFTLAAGCAVNQVLL